MKNLEIFKGNWTVNDVLNSPDKIFVYGDNNARTGKGGQAIIRDLPNTIGIRTKKTPDNKSISFYRDTELEVNTKNILEDILSIKELMRNGKTIVLSDGGYGTGLAQLKEWAPKTFEYLCQILKDNLHYDNKSGKKYMRVPSHKEMFLAKVVPINLSKIIVNDHKVVSVFDSIRDGYKIAETRKEIFNSGEIIKFTNDTNEFLICKVVISSYPVTYVSDTQWSNFEGFKKDVWLIPLKIDYANNIDSFQFHFEYICSIENDVIKFKD